jgi:hypothetical protein
LSGRTSNRDIWPVPGIRLRFQRKTKDMDGRRKSGSRTVLDFAWN